MSRAAWDLVTGEPCLLKPHYDRHVIDASIDEWAKTDPRARTHYDVVQCGRCKRWYVVRRPDAGDAA